MENNPFIPIRYSVLIVDDDVMWANLCKRELEKRGFSIDHVAGADQAADMLKKRRYHGAILDKNMPGLDGTFSKRAGIDLFEYIFNNYGDTSCLLLTDKPTFHSYREAEKLGMFAYQDKEEVGHREVAQLVSKMFETRLETVFTAEGMPIQADRMCFFGKNGTITKKASADTNPDYAGTVEIDGEKWKATTKGRMGTEIAVGRKVRAYGIRNGAIQVETGDY